jgi:RNA polymerase sigma-70 factor (ECF subfamily)
MLETFQSLRPRLFAIAYRMLGSASEAEDLLQEAWLRFQAVDPTTVRSAEALLTTIVTRLALDQLKSARVQREQYPGLWLPEPVVTPDQQLGGDPLDEVIKLESVSLAFLHLLETLSPEERAVFLLREVFDYDYKSIAEFLGKSESACRQLFHRAKSHMTAHRPRFSASADEHQRVLTGFLQAVQTGDLDSLMNLMAEDVASYADGGGKAVAALHPIVGRVKVARFIHGLRRFLQPEHRMEIVPVNGHPAIVLREGDGNIIVVMAIDVVDGKIQAFHNLLNPDKLKWI